MHARTGTRLQDAFMCFAAGTSQQALVALVSDGASSASHGGQGASLICRTIGLLSRQHFAAQTGLPDEAALAGWVSAAREKVLAAASARGLSPRAFSATLVMAVSDGAETLTAHVGDGAAIARDAGEGTWTALTWPEQGRYASSTYFVTDDTTTHTRISRHRRSISALAVLSDGLERLALDFRSEKPHGPFFEGMIAPVDGSSAAGRNRELSRRLSSFLDSHPVNSRTDDDKTLILATRR
jgi:hypothetical protein